MKANASLFWSRKIMLMKWGRYCSDISDVVYDLITLHTAEYALT